MPQVALEQMKRLRDYCHEANSVFLTPRTTGEILTFNNSGKLVLKDTEEIEVGVATKALNHNSMVTTFRRGVGESMQLLHNYSYLNLISRSQNKHLVL